MKTATFLPAATLLLLIIFCPVWQKTLEKERSKILNESRLGYLIPSKFTAPASLEFKGIVSDFLYLTISTFIGGKIVNKEMMDDTHAEYFYQAADLITDLDAWFWDAYLMNSMILAWDFNRVDLANKLLEKATASRYWDFNPPFYLGFNHYFFLHDNATASQYLMEAAKRGGGPNFLVPLATRLSVLQNKLTPAILLLQEQLKSTQDPVMIRHLQTRLKTVIILDKLEKKIEQYQSIHDRLPEKLNDLISDGLIDRLPDDPYGGQFYIQPNGRVFTTSKLRFSK